MKGPTEERWMQLCRDAVLEKDPDRLMDIVEEINRMLYEKEQRLKEQPASQHQAA